MIIYKEFSSLTEDLGVSARLLYSLSNSVDKKYHKVKIPKSKGGYRELSVPDDTLKLVQRKIANTLLVYEQVSLYATAYRFGTSIIQNAAHHIAKDNILKLDIKNFFDSITFSLVKEKVFPENRYSEANRVLLSKLCTYNNVLPQGAPTSPIISNIIMADFDEVVGKWCNENKITYTRYCDDMCFSGVLQSEKIIKFVKCELWKMGLLLNEKKTVFLRAGQKKEVTGIIVNEKLNVAKKYRKQIRQSIYYCKKFGVNSHLDTIGSNLPAEAYLKSLLGKVNFVLSVDPNNREMADYKAWLVNELKSI